MHLRTPRVAMGAVGITLAVWTVVGSAAPAAADTPTSWPDPEPMSTMDAILMFVGIPAGMFVVIALLVMAPSVARGPRYRPGLTWLAQSEQFGAQSAAAARTDTDEAGQQGREAFTVDQRRDIDKAIRYAEEASGHPYSVYVGVCHGRARAHAERLHGSLSDPEGSVLVLVDPATRDVEIVVGTQAGRRLDEQTAGLAVLSMQSAFGAGDLAGGIVAGLQLLGDHARRPESLHTD